MNVTNNY